MPKTPPPPPLNSPMGGAEMQAAREVFGMSQREMALMLGLVGAHSKDTVRFWETGKNPVSGPAAIAVRLLLERKLAEDALAAKAEANAQARTKTRAKAA